MEHTANIRKEFLPKYPQNLEKQNIPLYSSNIIHDLQFNLLYLVTLLIYWCAPD